MNLPIARKKRLRPLREILALAAVLAVAIPLATSAQVVISEFQADNSTGDGPEFRDENNQASDWIELTNVGTNTVDLRGWYLTDNPTFLPKWSFSGANTLLDSGAQLVVVASGLNMEGTRFRHSNFDLRGEDGYLALVAPDGTTVVHEYAGYPSQGRRRSFGLSVAGGSLPNYLYPPTPGEPNGDILRSVYISEIMYRPAPPPAGSPYDADDYQFIEIALAAPTLAPFEVEIETGGSVAGVTLDGRVQSIGLFVANRAAFESRYGAGLPILAEFPGTGTRLSGNAGTLKLMVGRQHILLTYDDRWHPATDGLGFSLVNRGPFSSRLYTPRGWRPSAAVGGSPGQPDPAFTVPEGVVVNEVLANSAQPYEDVIELFNTSTNAVDVGGWYLSDRLDNPKKFRIPVGTIVPAGGFMAFDEHSFNPAGGDDANGRFELRGAGEAIYLFSADAAGELTGYVHGFEFGPAGENVSIGRLLSSDGQEHFVPQAAKSFFEINAGPAAGPIAISEVNFDPPSAYGGFNVENTFDEYVELHNLTGGAVFLGGGPDGSGQRWSLREGVEYSFPAGAVIPPDGHVLVVGFDLSDPALLEVFRNAHGIPAGVPIYGPWEGKLSNNGDSVGLVHVDPALGDSWRSIEIPIDRVQYSPLLPWPRMAAGYGASLQRVDEQGYGSDPASWRAMPSTPGRSAPVGSGASTFTVVSSNLTVAAGTVVTLVVDAEPKELLGYQWFRGSPLYQATGPSLSISSVNASHAGIYTCFVFGPGGAVAVPILLTVTNSTTIVTPSPVTATITQPPTALMQTTGGGMTFSGTADGADIAGVLILQSSVINTVGHTSSRDYLAAGTTNWAVPVSLSAGTNWFTIYPLKMGGVGPPHHRIIEYLVEAPFQRSVIGSGFVSGPTNGQQLIIGRTYQLTSKPAAGQILRDWTLSQALLLSGASAPSAVLNFNMHSNLSVTATFIPNPFSAVAGTYDGLFHLGGTVTNAGSVTLHVGRKGGFVGSIQSDAGRRTFKGELNGHYAGAGAVSWPNGETFAVNFSLATNGVRFSGSVQSSRRGNNHISGGFRRPRAADRPAPGRYDLLFQDRPASTNDFPVPVGVGTLWLRPSGFARLEAQFFDGTRLVQRLPASWTVNSSPRTVWMPIYTHRSSGALTAFGSFQLDSLNGSLVEGVLDVATTGPGLVAQSMTATIGASGVAVLIQPTNMFVRITPDPEAAPATNVTFFIGASSLYPPLSYQWLFNGTRIPRATGPSVVVSNVSLAHEGDYHCAVTDRHGTLLSRAARLTPLITPRFTVPPLDQRVPFGGAVTVHATVSGNPAPFEFEWGRDTTMLQRATVPYDSNSFTFIAPSQLVVTQLHRVVVRNAASPGPGVAAEFRLTTFDPDLRGLTLREHPANVSVRIPPDPGAASTTNASFSIVAVTPNPPMTFQWRFNGTDLPGATGTSLVISNVSLADRGDYQCVVTDQLGTAVSSAARLTPLITPRFVIRPLDQRVVRGATITVSTTIFGNPAPFEFEWRRGALPLTASTSDQPSNSWTFTAPLTLVTNQLYRVVVRNAAYPVPGVASDFRVTTVVDTNGDGLPDEPEAAPAPRGGNSPVP